MFAEIVTALWRLYLASSFAAPSFKINKFTNETNFPLVSDLTNILKFPLIPSIR